MRSVVVTGMGLVTCLGRDKAAVSDRLYRMKHGVVRYSPFADNPRVPISVAAPLEAFRTDSPDPEDWEHPGDIRLRIDQLRSLAPHGLYATYAFQAAIEDAALSEEEVSNSRTGLYTASGGSSLLTAHHVQRMHKVGVARCSPMGIVSSIAGTLNFNLVAMHHILGSSTGFVSACASSGHALGAAFDEITLGRQDRMFVVGAEDFTVETIVPFASMRALTPSEDPDRASRPFDKNRDGFVGTGGAVTLVLEEESIARRRGAHIYGRFLGWGQATDGHHVAISHPDGRGLKAAMENALASAGCRANDISYVNAHATSTSIGDVAECRALRSVFGNSGGGPFVSSTKALTGHALSLSSIMEASFCLLAFENGFYPGSAHIETLDEEAQHLRILTESRTETPRRIMSNSSGFGGANVAIVMEHTEAAS